MYVVTKKILDKMADLKKGRKIPPFQFWAKPFMAEKVKKKSEVE